MIQQGIRSAQGTGATSCPLCNAVVIERAAHYPGYKIPTSYRILECASCSVQFADPLASDESLYEAIYRAPELMPGYDRYAGFAKVVENSSDALGFLAGSMEPYWAVKRALAGLQPHAKILDVGSGLGYLTFALVQAGLDATGLDISENAVASAKRRFGDHYRVGSLFKWADAYPESCDLVTILEVIEHVEDPVTWIATGFRLVKPGGKLVITTPNRDYYAAASVWATEAPPVHLWWFSPRSLRQMTAKLNADVEIVDFRDCSFKPEHPYSDEPVTEYRRPMLDARGRPSSRLRRVAAALGILPLAKNIWAMLHGPKDRLQMHPDPGMRETLAVILTKRA